MLNRMDLKKIMLIASGPILIEACEFDYSGIQALKSLHILRPKRGGDLQDYSCRHLVPAPDLRHPGLRGRIKGRCADQKIEAANSALPHILCKAKRYSYSDRQLTILWKQTEDGLRPLRKLLGFKPMYYLKDTCFAEFEAYTPYYYSTYETGDEVSAYEPVHLRTYLLRPARIPGLRRGRLLAEQGDGQYLGRRGPRWTQTMSCPSITRATMSSSDMPRPRVCPCNSL